MKGGQLPIAASNRWLPRLIFGGPIQRLENRA